MSRENDGLTLYRQHLQGMGWGPPFMPLVASLEWSLVTSATCESRLIALLVSSRSTRRGGDSAVFAEVLYFEKPIAKENFMGVPPAYANVLNLPKPPSFTNVADERRHRKEKLAGAFRLFSRFGFDEGVAGHITARDPERTDHFWVNPFGVHFGQVCVSNLILVNAAGEVVEGNHAVNKAAFAIHSQVHHARPDVIAAAHSHSLYGKTWSSLGRLLDPLTQDSCAFFEDHAVFHDFTGVVYQTSEGERIAQALGQRKAVILRNHGLLTVGETVDEAAWWFITMERTCQAQLMAEAAGKPIPIDRENAVLTRDQVGTHMAGWFQFQPLWQRISKEQPDLFD